jgi:diadenosine tetraphosphate (Ap4A) HIT family hydrolase
MIDMCEFCERLGQHQAERPWYDFHVVHESGSFVTVAAMGALVPGYVLIIPRVHVFSMASLDAGLRAELRAYEREVHERIASRWRSATLFEHGSCARPAAATGACISHAHWHLLPGDFDLDGWGIGFRRAHTFDVIAERDRPHGYLSFRTTGGEWYFNTTHRPASQHFRRIIAAQLGRPAEWDYLAFPMLDQLRDTIVGLTGRDPAALYSVGHGEARP